MRINIFFPLILIMIAQFTQAKSEIREITSPEQEIKESIYFKVVVDKDKNLVVYHSTELSNTECELKDDKMMISIKDMNSSQIKKIKCNFIDRKGSLYHLDDFLSQLKNENVKKIYLEPIIIPYIHQATPNTLNFARIINNFLKRNKIIDKSFVVSKNLKLLRTLKGQVNKDQKIIFRIGDNRPDYLQVAKYYNLHGVMPHYQWIYDDDIKRLKEYQNGKIELILWGEISPYIKKNLMKKNTNGILITR